ncbi:hypothetical protein GCK72_023031 [Caenorhabditis remanei]|uniref:Uncharacterized protein n=1 Tax=Caenorhabditis remanei TaxID=31234 RepID=A0A6A5FVN8_CAERE|nr:hypothetical protein GCK72_023031 [Caenorhabditis remanei]KAF1746574.1 hypothetical protein GCK72_023031 [Caenorhabditis remanei]
MSSSEISYNVTFSCKFGHFCLSGLLSEDDSRCVESTLTEDITSRLFYQCSTRPSNNVNIAINSNFDEKESFVDYFQKKYYEPTLLVVHNCTVFDGVLHSTHRLPSVLIQRKSVFKAVEEDITEVGNQIKFNKPY